MIFVNGMLFVPRFDDLKEQVGKRISECTVACVKSANHFATQNARERVKAVRLDCENGRGFPKKHLRDRTREVLGISTVTS